MYPLWETKLKTCVSPLFRLDIRCGRRRCQLLQNPYVSSVSAPVGLATPSHTARVTVILWHLGSSCWKSQWGLDRPCSPKQTLLWLRISHSTTAPSQRSRRAHRARRQEVVWEQQVFIKWMHRVKVHYLDCFQVKLESDSVFFSNGWMLISLWKCLIWQHKEPIK